MPQFWSASKLIKPLSLSTAKRSTSPSETSMKWTYLTCSIRSINNSEIERTLGTMGWLILLRKGWSCWIVWRKQRKINTQNQARMWSKCKAAKRVSAFSSAVQNRSDRIYSRPVVSPNWRKRRRTPNHSSPSKKRSMKLRIHPTQMPMINGWTLLQRQMS